LQGSELDKRAGNWSDMTKDETIHETEKILKELTFLLGLHDHPDAICLSEVLIQFMKEELDEKKCEFLRIGLMEYLKAEVLKRSVSDALENGEVGEVS